MASRGYLVPLALLGALLPMSAAADPLFERDPLAIDPLPCAGQCPWRELVVADFDGDGRLDVLGTGAAGITPLPLSAAPLVLLRGDGAGLVDVSLAAFGGFAGVVNQPAVGDFDGDGDLDVFAPDADGGPGPDVFFINQGDGTFVDEAASRVPAEQIQAGVSRAGDLDGDGDLDIFQTDGYAADFATSAIGRVLLNDGTGHFGVGPELPTDLHGGISPVDVELLDIDGDADLDAVIALYNETTLLWQNDGTGHFIDISDPTLTLDAPNSLKDIVACDVEGDGDLDVWITGTGEDQTEQLWVNDGSGHFVDQALAQVVGNPPANDITIDCADVDVDGDFDMIVWHWSTQIDLHRVLINDGEGFFEAAAMDTITPADQRIAASAGGDFDGDGRLDWIAGTAPGSGGEPWLYRGSSMLPADDRPPHVRAHDPIGYVEVDDAPVVRFAITDQVVSELGPQLERAWVHVEVSDGGAYDIDARYVGGDLFEARFSPQSEYVFVTYQLCARDRNGNEACVEGGSFNVDDGDPDTSGSGPTSNDEVGDGGSSESGGSSGSSDGGATDETSGCACSPGEDVAPAWSLALVILCGTLRRRPLAHEQQQP